MKYKLQVNDKNLESCKFKADVEFDDINEFNKHLSDIMVDKKFPMDIVFVVDIDGKNEAYHAVRLNSESKYNPNEIILTTFKAIDKWKKENGIH